MQYLIVYLFIGECVVAMTLFMPQWVEARRIVWRRLPAHYTKPPLGICAAVVVVSILIWPFFGLGKVVDRKDGQ